MRAYETVFVLRPDLEKEALTATIDKVKAVIETSGEVESVEEWGSKKLAYEIDKKYNDGYFVLINFVCDNSVLDELEHIYRINDEFIRNIIVKKEK